MMDKIEEIIISAFDSSDDPGMVKTAKQIRQLVGHELFERHQQGWVHSDDIKEICKLPPYDKK